MTGDFDIDWPLPPSEAAAIAVSGGADSFALLHWAWKAGHPVVALTVDHQLREGSAAEAQSVRTFCSERNIPHETLIWRGEKPKTGIQAAAREARYRLLCQACERTGIEHLLTGHTADDQAETVFMRLRRGAGRGLAGMPSERRIAAGPGELITLHRPMLGVRREAARAYAEAAGVPFVDDPSNDDEKYERVRVRALLAALEQQGLLTVEALCQIADDQFWLQFKGRCRITTSSRPDPGLVPGGEPAPMDRSVKAAGHSAYGSRIIADALSGKTADIEGPFAMAEAWVDGAVITFEPFIDAEFIDRLIRAVGGAAQAIRSGLHQGNLVREGQTLGGTCLQPINDDFYDQGDEAWVFFREPAALLGRADGTSGFAPVPAGPGSKHLYDRRFIVTVPKEATKGLHLRPLGQLIPRDIATSTLARQRIATLPCLARGDSLYALPEQATEAVTNALTGWKQCDAFLSTMERTFEARSLLSERFAGDVIRY